MTFFATFRKILFKLLVFLVTLIFMAFVLAILPLLLPIYTYRFILSKSFRIFRPDLSKILATRSQIHAIDDMYTNPKASLVVQLKFDGQFQSIEIEREFMLKQLVLAKDEAGNLKRPEFQQYSTSWMGFYFWKKDPNFKIENHFFEYDGPRKSDSYDEAGLYQIGVDCISAPFKKKQSPWEFLIFRNCTSGEYPRPFTGMILRIHHSLADGFAILKFANEVLSSEESLEPMQILRPKVTICRRICRTLSMVVRVPFEFIECMLSVHDINDWHIPEEKLSRIPCGFHTKISVNSVKEVKNLHSVTFTSVVLAGLCGAIRTFMLQHGIKVPEGMHCFTTLPASGHPDKLRNYSTYAYVKLPIGTDDPVERLHMIDKDLERLRKSTLPLVFLQLIPVIGGLLSCMTKALSKQTLPTVLVANFPGPQSFVKYMSGGLPLLDIIVGGGPLPGNIGLGLSACSYNGTLRAGATMDQILLPDPANTSVKELVENIGKEIDVLHVMGTV